MSVLLDLESEEVRMVGIWGSSGIGKTTIARALYSRLSRHFQGRIFIDRAFISKNLEDYRRANPDDYNMKLSLQGKFLSEILGKKDTKIDHLGAVRDRLKHQKVLIVIDDLDDQVVLDALAGQNQWFGCGSRIIVVTNDKHLLTAHEIDRVYEVPLPSEKRGLEMLCLSAFRQNSPPKGFKKFAVAVAWYAGSLPLGLNVMGSDLRGRHKEYWKDMLPRLRNGLDGKIEKTLNVGYVGLGSEKDKAIFRHIACFFNYAPIHKIKLFLANSNLDVNIGLENLADKSLIQVRWDRVEMHRLLQELGRNIVRMQSIDDPGKREFLMDSKDICDVLSENTGTKKVLGISLNIDKIDELHVHEDAFKGMCNLRFLRIYNAFGKDVRLHLPESFDFLPPNLKMLWWYGYPMRCMPSKFRPENLVELKMQKSKLEKLWEGVVSPTYLKVMDLSESENLKEIPDLSMATNLERLRLKGCSSLVELPPSIRHFNNLTDLIMYGCTNLETLLTEMKLKSLYCLDLRGCSRLRDFSTKEPLAPLGTMLPPSPTKMYLSVIPSLVELRSFIENFNKLEELWITGCTNLETLPTGINLECYRKFYYSLGLVNFGLYLFQLLNRFGLH